MLTDNLFNSSFALVFSTTQTLSIRLERVKQTLVKRELRIIVNKKIIGKHQSALNDFESPGWDRLYFRMLKEPVDEIIALVFVTMGNKKNAGSLAKDKYSFLKGGW